MFKGIKRYKLLRKVRKINQDELRRINNECQERADHRNKVAQHLDWVHKARR